MNVFVCVPTRHAHIHTFIHIYMERLLIIKKNNLLSSLVFVTRHGAKWFDALFV